MTKIDIVSGFLGAGKTTLLKKLIGEALEGCKVVLIENEFGEIGIDGGFLKDAGIEIKEMNSGCICCSLVGDFGTSLKEVLVKYQPDRILIEPSGVGKLSDVIRAVEVVTEGGDVVLNSAIAVVDASKCRMYMKNFGEFFSNQIAFAGTVILSRTEQMSLDKVGKCVDLIREQNADAVIITTPWNQLEGKVILETMEGARDLKKELLRQVLEEHGHAAGHGEGHGKGHGHGEGCGHGKGHGHGEGCGHGEGHGHGEGCGHGKGHGHGEGSGHGDGCDCGCHEHGEGHHHAEEVFMSWGLETADSYTQREVKEILAELEDEKKYGFVLRSKGMLPNGDGGWVYFDYVPGEAEVRTGQPDVTGKVCVIGSQLKEGNLASLFQK